MSAGGVAEPARAKKRRLPKLPSTKHALRSPAT